MHGVQLSRGNYNNMVVGKTNFSDYKYVKILDCDVEDCNDKMLNCSPHNETDFEPKSSYNVSGIAI